MLEIKHVWLLHEFKKKFLLKSTKIKIEQNFGLLHIIQNCINNKNNFYQNLQSIYRY